MQWFTLYSSSLPGVCVSSSIFVRLPLLYNTVTVTAAGRNPVRSWCSKRSCRWSCSVPRWSHSLMITFSMLQSTSVGETSETAFVQCRHILVPQKDSVAIGNIFKKLKHASIIIGHWDIRLYHNWSLRYPLKCASAVYISVGISITDNDRIML